MCKYEVRLIIIILLLIIINNTFYKNKKFINKTFYSLHNTVSLLKKIILYNHTIINSIDSDRSKAIALLCY